MVELKEKIKKFFEKEFDTNKELVDELFFQNNVEDLDKITTEKFYAEAKFYKLKQLGYDDKYPPREAFENVLAAMDNPGIFNFVYIISGKQETIDIFLGVVKNYEKTSNLKLSAANYGQILESSIAGNFQGSVLDQLKYEQIENLILNPIKKSKRFSLIKGVPTFNEDSGKSDSNFQGMDRLINSMANRQWQLIIVCEPVLPSEVLEIKEEIYNLYNELHSMSKISIQETNGKGESDGIAEQTEGYSITETSGTQDPKNNTNYSKAVGKDSTSKSKNKGTSKNYSKSESVEIINKKYSELLQYLEKEMLERLSIGYSKGYYQTAIYAFGNDLATLEQLQNNIMSIFQGNKSLFSPLKVKNLAGDNSAENDKKKEMILKFQILEKKYKTQSNDISPLIHSQYYKNDKLSLSTYLTAKEISLVGGLPSKEVPGVILNEGVDFGLNVNEEINKEDSIQLGYILHRGRKLENNKIQINKKSLNQHIFIAGVTGSGKTTTCQKLLTEANIPFLVIEPAKTEYRILLNDKIFGDNLKIYTLGTEKYAPFRFNPFELLKGESISSHIDMIKATFIASFPMEAAMPYIIEEAIYKIYKDYGWNTDTGINYKSEDPWSENGKYWPILTDFLAALEDVIKSKKFGPELEANYRGALIARFSNLTIGSKGKMLNTKLSIDIKQLMKSNTIIELEELKDPTEKSLMMGFILSRCAEAAKQNYYENKNYKHITLIEEAHRLLSKFEPGDAGSKKTGVNVFTDLLAEIRKYGESFIIVDQIPNKLTPEVLKNTNTKIIHRLFAKDDKEAVGNTMALNDKQKDYLSLMKAGEAVIFSQSWNKSVNIFIERKTNTTEISVDESKIQKIGLNQLLKEINVFYNEFSYLKEKLETSEISSYIHNKNNILESLNRFIQNSQKLTEFDNNDKLIQQIKSYLNRFMELNKKKSILYKLLSYSLYLNNKILFKNLEEISFITFISDFFKSVEENNFNKINDFISDEKGRELLNIFRTLTIN